MLRKLLLPIKGILIGGADLIPGLSGGTVALLTGVYGRLLHALHGLNHRAVTLVLRGQLSAAWQQIDGAFLFPLGGGIATGVVLLARPVAYLWTRYPLPVQGFLLGLTLAGTILMAGQLHRRRFRQLPFFVVGTVILFLLTRLTPVAMPHSWWALIGSGALASCAMLLPGISGSYVLLLLGQYAYVLHALSTWQWRPLLFVSLGCVLGILASARAIAFLLRRYHDPVLVFLAGGLLGALHRLWPWQQAMYVQGAVGVGAPLMSRLLTPMGFQALLEQDAQVLPVLFFMGVGFTFPLTLARWTAGQQPREGKGA